MSEAYASGCTRGTTGGDSVNATALGAAGWLCLATAPTFAAMALWTGFSGGQSDMLCIGTHGASPLSGMTLMYALMSAFHAPPWLKLISRAAFKAQA